MTRLSERLSCTPGQAYTLITGVVLALALTLSSTGVITKPALGEAARSPRSTSTTVSATTSPLPPGGGLPLPPSLTVGSGDLPADDTATTAPPTTPDEVACPARPLLDAVGPVVDTLQATTGVVPSVTTKKLLAAITGCSIDDPAALLLALLAEIANALPEPPFEIPGLPSLGQIPEPILDLVQPFRSLLDPICGGVGTVAAVLTLSLSAYPPYIVAAAINAVLPLLDVCGQIQKT